MPWRHNRPALCIWLESNLDSRVVKSIVSHRGRSQFKLEDYHERITEKDKATISLYKNLYNIDIGNDLSCFDLILDISSLITEPTLQASLKSIAITHKIIHPAVGWYLTKTEEFRNKLITAIEKYPHLIKFNNLFD